MATSSKNFGFGERNTIFLYRVVRKQSNGPNASSQTNLWQWKPSYQPRTLISYSSRHHKHILHRLLSARTAAQACPLPVIKHAFEGGRRGNGLNERVVVCWGNPGSTTVGHWETGKHLNSQAWILNNLPIMMPVSMLIQGIFELTPLNEWKTTYKLAGNSRKQQEAAGTHSWLQ